MAKLYVAGTPIGNLQDASARLRETLAQADIIYAEDTRVTMKLMQVFDLHTPLQSMHRHNEMEKAAGAARRILEEDLYAALVTDAGMPCISDPGYMLVRECAALGIEVLSVPGPCAAPSALSVSGIEGREWTFYGFLPRERRDLEEKLRAMAGERRAAVVYESPFRVLDLMESVSRVFPGVFVSVSCDLTKLHEKTLRGPVSEVLEIMRANPKTEKGEYCIVLDMQSLPPEEEAPREEQPLEEELLLTRLMLEGISLREAQEKLVENGHRKNAVKAAALRLRRIWEE